MRMHFVCSTVPSMRSAPRSRAPRLAQSLCVYNFVPSCTHLTTNLTTERLQRFTNQFVSIFFRQWIVYVAECGGKFCMP